MSGERGECRTCRHYDDYGSGNAGKCRALPPVVVIVPRFEGNSGEWEPGGPETMWPEVAAADGCGTHQPTIEPKGF